MEDLVNNSLVDSENENVVENMNIVEEEGLGDGDSMCQMWVYNSMIENRKGRRSTNVVGSLKPQPTMEMDCKAKISASSDVNGTWRINIVNLEHNHTCSPSKSRKLEVNDIVGIPLHKSFNSAVVEAGGYENLPCVEKDCRNYIKQVRRLQLGEDDKLRLKNVFGTDNRCRQTCREFGDVVTFDTTYLTNKYNMHFPPFVGVNHHGQSTLLGCGLLSNEDTYTFVWLFKTWLEYTKLRWCLCHILKKLLEKFGYHVDKENIFSDIHRLLAGLYNNRARWVPCFLKTTFWAGMSTTQQSESMNAFFDRYVRTKTLLKQFVEQYERAPRNKVEKEYQADFKSYFQMVPCATNYEMEKQFQLVYTISKFREVQEEFTGKTYCDLVAALEGSSGTTYEILEDVLMEHIRKKKSGSSLFGGIIVKLFVVATCSSSKG
ncbi:protein FAR1-RELATED SEQUENCE 5-like [Olea europaea var. sylvestris]|uniref:protein FAR1-RELATED SEQUENCE 5-like n=1 Tax=Olea europaea var. sylvestris TaxID=158386 RepID=UPI000C1D3D2C|nr:protein FAR1-RELATED SEQUENCE 5-like [Olea europaea var. sylvestris]